MSQFSKFHGVSENDFGENWFPFICFCVRVMNFEMMVFERTWPVTRKYADSLPIVDLQQSFKPISWPVNRIIFQLVQFRTVQIIVQFRCIYFTRIYTLHLVEQPVTCSGIYTKSYIFGHLFPTWKYPVFYVK